jgi:hypothetical protein
MTRFEPLLQITLEHAYYADGLCRGLRFVPDEDTEAWMTRRGCISRATGAGVLVLAPSSEAEPSDDASWLSFHVHSSDHGLAAVTADLPRGSDEILLLVAAQVLAPAAADELQSLHAGPRSGEGERWPLAWPMLSQSLGTTARRTPPLAVVRVPAPRALMRYRARLAARATVWQYWLLGEWTEGALRIVDSDNQVQFTEPETRVLNDGRTALAVRSLGEIELRQRSTARFQLRSRASAAERVLVKRLPVAGADPFVRETPDPRSRLVSEIYVHR